ncbi:phage integrase SAM-like domain-containing protein [Culturomica massiliensis]|uniref:phage integrase SAM-like domain-containing protein n=2 Tax=Culturomica massiliensis TaxID=1841857 RepID=UPI0008397F09|nr:phage integrase SAM-like domain-containing protein [Culturomica massiliensis]
MVDNFFVNDIKTAFIADKGYMTVVEVRDKYVNLTKTAEEKEKDRKKLEQQEAERLEKERQEREEQERRERGISLIDYFNNYIESRRDEVAAGQLTGKTFSRYESARDRLITYMEEKYKVSDMPLKHIDLFFIKNFEIHVENLFNCNEQMRLNKLMKKMQIWIIKL